MDSFSGFPVFSLCRTECMHSGSLKIKVIHRHSNKTVNPWDSLFFCISDIIGTQKKRRRSDIGGNYEKGIYSQLMDVMARLDCVEKDYKKDIHSLNDRIDELTKENDALRKENQLLKNDNAHLKSIINNDSSNTSQPPSTDQKGGKPANTFNGKKKTQRKADGQKGHAGTTLTKSDIEEKIASGKCRHEIRTTDKAFGQDYVTKYVVDLNVEPVITELRIYADENGNFPIPAQYRSDVTYGGNVKALAVTLYSEGVMSNDRIAAFLNAAGNGELALSEGSVYGFCQKFAEASGGKHPASGGETAHSGCGCNGRHYHNGKRKTELYTEFQCR